MYLRNTFALVVLGLLALGCGLMGGGQGIAVETDGKSATVEPKSTAVIVDTVGDTSSGKAMVSHTFVIANYDLGDKVSKMSLQGSAKEEGKMRVEFTIIGAKGTDEKTPVKQGEYPSRVGNTGSPENTANGGRFSYAGEKREESKGTSLADMKAGKIKIDSVSGDTITGEVDLTDGTTSIKGKFSVKAK